MGIGRPGRMPPPPLPSLWLIPEQEVKLSLPFLSKSATEAGLPIFFEGDRS